MTMSDLVPFHMTFPTLLLMVFIAYCIQMFFLYFQLKDYKKEVSAASKKGTVGVARKKGAFGGEVVIFIADADGFILETRHMKGATVFARFKPSDLFLRMHVQAAIEELAHDKKRRYMIEALEKIKNK